MKWGKYKKMSSQNHRKKTKWCNTLKYCRRIKVLTKRNGNNLHSKMSQ